MRKRTDGIVSSLAVIDIFLSRMGALGWAGALFFASARKIKIQQVRITENLFVASLATQNKLIFLLGEFKSHRFGNYFGNYFGVVFFEIGGEPARIK